MTLVGVPGIGKSRSLRSSAGWWRTTRDLGLALRRCLPYGDGVSFWALGEIVKAQEGIHENDDADLTAAELAAVWRIS